MYRTLASAKVVLNNHIDMVGPYAANLRLYETTGVGSCLLTEQKQNLDQLFEPGVEVLTYEDTDDCVSTLKEYLRDDEERRTVARSGQERTLADHTYRDRMQTLTAFFERLR